MLCAVATTIGAIVGCNNWEEPQPGLNGSGSDGAAMSTDIVASCHIDNRTAPLASGRLAQRSLVSSTTTQALPSNFLRIDEDIDSHNNGLYTFTGHDASTPYDVNWNRAYLLEAVVTASPDNSAENLRSISLEPVQSYNINIIDKDTTHFYHTRMVGWHPRTCDLPRRDGVAANTQFENERFNAVRCNDRVEIRGVEQDVVGIHFTGLNGQTDLMVSDVCEGQHWHIEGTSSASDFHPSNPSQNIYYEPFGHNTNPYYRNFFNYRHYLSAVRIFAYAEQSSQSLSMWGDIEGINLKNQPTSCKVSLPNAPGEFGEVYYWGDYQKIPIAQGLIYGELCSDADMNVQASYPISLNGADQDHQSYLGYALIQPDKSIDIELHTTSGVYSVNVSTNYTDSHGNDHEIFKEGMIYDIHLNLKTDGLIAAILEQDNGEHFYDLSKMHEYSSEDDIDISTYKFANCYVVDPTALTVPSTGGYYDGYCFSATIIGNGEAGIISSGAQTMYPTSAEISPVRAALLWESRLGLISQVELLYGYVRFRVPDKSAEGNAVIAVYDEAGKILWSWHIWITDMPQQHSFKVGTTEFTILDRNLGATASQWTGASDALETYGLYYQWGRKDPSMGPPTYNYYPINLTTSPYYDYSSQEKDAAEVVQLPQPTLRDGIENPMYIVLPTQQTQSYLYNWTYTKYDFLWGYDRTTGITDKTIYDPCPYGYRVSGGELGTLFSYIDGTESFTYTDYGQIRTVPKVANQSGETVKFYFPYTGYKGVDRGLNSLVGSWRYVGRKADLQSSIISTTADDESYMHRSRIYLSSEASWSELNVGNYQGRQIVDFTNRRTAAPVRCVKGVQAGRLVATLTTNRASASANSTVTINCSARSYESHIQSVKLTVAYHLKDGDEHVEREIYSSNSGLGLEWANSFSYHIPDEDFLETTTGVFRFVLTVQNEMGLSRIASSNVTINDNAFDFTYWQGQDESDYQAQLPVVGKNISRAVRIYGNAEPIKVTINGVDVTSTKNTRANSTYAYDAYYGIGTNFGNITSNGNISFSTRGYHTLTVEATYADGTVISESRDIGVWGLALTPKTNTTFTQGTYYVLSNTAYSSTYLYDNGNYLAAETLSEPIYRSLFYIYNKTICNVETGDYCTGYNNVQVGASSNSGTQYNFSYSNGQFNIYYSSSRSYYWKQTNATTTNVSRNATGNYNWYIYEAELVPPQAQNTAKVR